MLNKTADLDQRYLKRMTFFDYFALVGLTINVIVITLIVGHWILH